MSTPAVSVHQMWKQYRIGPRPPRYRTLRDTLTSLAGAAFERARTGKSPKFDTFWALRDVTFEVPAGEATGIIGRNGAGKSTLLKILSRITEPTKGTAKILGRVSSLLEVGVGFKGELTGRENIYLNGAILGMKRTEIDRRFDEIVAFAEIERFLDTPVKHYSSGMALRLGFAVAAHLEPEVLIVDEVLAVGDAGFQRKCLSKMEDVGREGRTVLFVSHNMPAVTRLCKRAVLLDGGRILSDGPALDVVSAYLKTGLGTTACREWEPGSRDRPGDVVAALLAVRVRSEDGRITDIIDIRKPVRVEMEFDVWKDGYVLTPFFGFQNEEGIRAFSTADTDPEWRGKSRAPGRYVSTVWIPGNLLAEGTLFVRVELLTERSTPQFRERDVVAFQVVDTLDGDSARGSHGGPLQGVLRPLLRWTTEHSPGF